MSRAGRIPAVHGGEDVNEKAARQEEWAAAYPDLLSLAGKWDELSGEIDRLRALLRRHGIEAEDEPA